jgi:tetratricopeptide (TPR) repeat protein
MRSRLSLILILLTVVSVSCSRDPQKLKQKYVASGDKYTASKQFREAIVQYRSAVQTDPNFGEARFKLATAYAEVGDLQNALREYVRAADLMPTNVEAQLRAGNGLVAAGQYPEAKARALAALQSDPKNVRALILLGNSLGALKDLDGAIARVQEAVDADPQEILAYSNLGALELVKGNRAAAEAAFKRAVEVNPNSSEAHLGLANYYWASRQTTEAERELKKALELEPKSLSANRGLAVFYAANGSLDETEHYLKAYADLTADVGPRLALADLYVRRGRIPEAQATLETLAKTKEGFAPAKLRLASLDFLDNRRPQAYDGLNEVLKQDAKNPGALLQKGRFLLIDRKIAEATAVATQLATQNPDSAPAQYLRGTALRASGSRDEALKAFQEALKLDPGATAVLLHLADLNLALGNAPAAAEFAGQAVKRSPTLVLAHLLLGSALLRQGNLVGAGREVAGLAKAAATSADVATFVGKFYLAKGDFAHARASFEEALKLQADATEAFAALVSIDLTQGRPDATRARIEARLVQTPKDEQTLLLAGKVFQALGDQKRAEASYRQILEQNPSNFEIYNRLGALYTVQNRLEEAKKEYEDLAQRQPKMAAAARTMVGTILEVQNKPAEALKQYERALELDGRMPLAANNLAWAYAKDGRLDMALQFAQTAKAGAPSSGYVSDTLGWIYYQKGLVGPAVVALEEAVKQAPSNPTIHYHLGLSYAKQGEREKARRAFEQALKLNPKFDEADDTRRQLLVLKG